MSPDRIPVFHWQVALEEELRQAANARWRAQDEARAKAAKPAPSQRPVKPPRTRATPDAGKDTRQAPVASVRPASQARRPDPPTAPPGWVLVDEATAKALADHYAIENLTAYRRKTT